MPWMDGTKGREMENVTNHHATPQGPFSLIFRLPDG